MNRDDLIKRIRAQARRDEKNRNDRRYLDTLGFLTAKGFLFTNLNVRPLPNKRLWIDDVLWAGRNVEPRILEVLPAALLRLAGHFEGMDPTRHAELTQVVELLRKNEKIGPPLWDIPYEKIRTWVDFPLRDKRIKPVHQKKVTRTFRLAPAALECLKLAARKQGTTETEVLQKLLLSLV